MRIVATSCATCGEAIRLAYFRGESRQERPVPVQAEEVVALVGPGLGEEWSVRQSFPMHAPFCGRLTGPVASESRRRRRRTGQGDTMSNDEPLVAILHAIAAAPRV